MAVREGCPKCGSTTLIWIGSAPLRWVSIRVREVRSSQPDDGHRARASTESDGAQLRGVRGVPNRWFPIPEGLEIGGPPPDLGAN